MALAICFVRHPSINLRGGSFFSYIKLKLRSLVNSFDVKSHFNVRRCDYFNYLLDFNAHTYST